MLQKYGSWTEESANMWRCPLPHNLECVDWLKLLGEKIYIYHHICKEKLQRDDRDYLNHGKIYTRNQKSICELGYLQGHVCCPQAEAVLPMQRMFQDYGWFGHNHLAWEWSYRFFLWPFALLHPLYHSTSLFSSVCKVTVLAHTALPLHLSFLALLEFSWQFLSFILGKSYHGLQILHPLCILVTLFFSLTSTYWPLLESSFPSSSHRDANNSATSICAISLHLIGIFSLSIVHISWFRNDGMLESRWSFLFLIYTLKMALYNQGHCCRFCPISFANLDRFWFM